MSKIIFITGASTGIGAECAKTLAGNNEVIIHYNRSKVAAEKTAEIVVDNGGKPFLVQADITEEESCIELIDKVKQKYPRLDVLINNAGGEVERLNAKTLTWKNMLDTFSLNTFSAMKISSLCIGLLEKSMDPVIVNITTMAIRHGGRDSLSYAAAKGALDVFTRGLARELAPKIRVNAVAPGFIDTPLVRKFVSPERIKEVIKESPLQKTGEVSQVAMTVKFLIENNFITGETIDVNGGLFMR